MMIIICAACGSELIYKRMSSTVYEIYHSGGSEVADDRPTALP